MRAGPKKSSSAIGNRIVTLAKRDPFISSKAIASEFGKLVSQGTVQRRLLKPKQPGRIARKVLLLGLGLFFMGWRIPDTSS